MIKKYLNKILFYGLISLVFTARAGTKDWETQKKLSDAIAKDDEKAVANILKEHPSLVNKAVKFGTYPVLDAARKGSIKALKTLVEHGGDLKKTDSKTGNTVLHMLVTSKPKEEKLEEALSFLITEKKLKLNAKNKEGKTPFIYAFSYSQFTPPARQNIPIIKVFTKYKADLNTQDKLGKTALHYLVGGFNTPSKIDLVKETAPAILLANQKGVDVNIADKLKRTPLITFLANTKSGNNKQKIPLVTCLLENGAKNNAKSKKGEKPLKMVDKKSELYQVLKKTKKKRK